MGPVHFEAATDKPFAQFQSDLDQALRESFAAHVLTYSWEGQTLQISAPGSKGDVRLEDGRALAQIQLSFPATFMKETIIRDIATMLEKAAGNPVEILRT